jgi:hypothetical protein
VLALDIHGGIGEDEIISFVRHAEMTTQASQKKLILFFDEINTSSGILTCVACA